jgi:signal peptidase II
MSALAGMAERRGYFLLSLAVIVLDQATKIAAHRFLAGGSTVEIVPRFFNLVYSRNAGGLFGSFRDVPDPWRLLLLTVLPIVAVGLIAAYLARLRPADRPTLCGLALILGGAVGNLIDRLARGEVVDFLDVYIAPSKLAEWLVSVFGTAHWPTFNVADSSIVVGAGLLLLSLTRPAESEAREPEAPSRANAEEPL